MLGVPEPLRFTDQASALHAFAVGARCEPNSDYDSIIMANSIINSAPIVLGRSTPKARRSLAALLYRVSRELIGQDNADRLHFPPRKGGINPIRPLRWRNRAERLLRSFPGSRRPSKQLLRLLDASKLADYKHNYALPTTLHDEESGSW